MIWGICQRNLKRNRHQWRFFPSLFYTMPIKTDREWKTDNQINTNNNSNQQQQTNKQKSTNKQKTNDYWQKTLDKSNQKEHGIQGTYLLLFNIEHLFHFRNLDFNLQKCLAFVSYLRFLSLEVEFEYTLLPRLPNVSGDFKAVFLNVHCLHKPCLEQDLCFL